MAYDYRRTSDTGITSSALAWACWYVMTIPPVTEDDADYVGLVGLGLVHPPFIREPGSLGLRGDGPADTRDLLGGGV